MKEISSKAINLPDLTLKGKLTCLHLKCSERAWVTPGAWVSLTVTDCSVTVHQKKMHSYVHHTYKETEEESIFKTRNLSWGREFRGKFIWIIICITSLCYKESKNEGH
jgi:hypothetical protein